MNLQKDESKKKSFKYEPNQQGQSDRFCRDRYFQFHRCVGCRRRRQFYGRRRTRLLLFGRPLHILKEKYGLFAKHQRLKILLPSESINANHLTIIQRVTVYGRD